MNMHKKIGWAAVLLTFMLAACGGDGPGLAGGRNGPGTDPGDGGGGPGGSPDDPQTLVLGSVTGDTFQPGVIAIGVANLSSGGTTSISVQIRNSAGAVFTDSVDITFSSNCQAEGLAEIADGVITTTTGAATTTYTDKGCAKTDTIRARAIVEGQELSASGTIDVAAPSLGSIEFVSAEPETIGLRGTGALGIQETAIVKFRVKNDVGGPMPGARVNFRLNTEVGGISLSTSSAESGPDGIVGTTIRSGSVATPVSVIATVEGSNIATQSSRLAVGTAIPDQDSVSLSASVHNPEAWNYDGEEVELTIRLADRFNNPVPDGTTISFTTELGSVDSSCRTENGACTVAWRSQEPRLEFDGNAMGRTTIIAYTIGEESFKDANGNGKFDGTSADLCSPSTPAGVDCYYDIPEAWLDENEDGVHNSPNERFIDYNEDGVWTGPNSQWDGISCNETVCSGSLVNVWTKAVLVMARSHPDILFFDGTGSRITGTVTLPANITACIGGTGTFEPAASMITDIADIVSAQPMPANTTISFQTDPGEIRGSTTDWKLGSTNAAAPQCYSYYVAGTDTGEPGYFEVKVSTPKGNETIGLLSIVDSPDTGT